MNESTETARNELADCEYLEVLIPKVSGSALREEPAPLMTFEEREIRRAYFEAIALHLKENRGVALPILIEVVGENEGRYEAEIHCDGRISREGHEPDILGIWWYDSQGRARVRLTFMRDMDDPLL
jgi:hypothetical protein